MADIFTLHGAGVWIAAIMTLAVLSFLYKENPLYRLAEHIVVGTSVGYGLVLTYHLVFKPYWIDELIMSPELSPFYFVKLLGAMTGLLWLTALSPKFGWLARYPMAIGMGFSSGYIIPLIIQASLLVHLRATWENLIIHNGASIDMMATLWGVVMFVGVLSVLCYFFFSIPHKGVYGKFTNLGIWFLMVSFGASFGYTVMARLSLFIGRLQFLLTDWLGLVR